MQQDMVRLTGAGHPARTGAAWVLFAGIDLPPAIGVGPRIERMFQQILQSHAVGATPLQHAFDRSFPQPHSHRDVMLPEIA
jgi:hypothetical protein